ncbi:zinc ribbon domain-containing protein [Silvimonas iriomotensis]|uniref:Double zinc ribbon n=1 Tax=Silvimonas iriomotensis TaxID=449662 RepID=A0ABQ2P827_9NEIS|nr:zinc ribbon domain-containing protein [Silvimonas iriomotensis]GGP20395.1 hypothetical protein GCM10010970_15010 [Silvimonas iriomotensis]
MATSQAHSRPERLLRIASWIVALVFAGLLNTLGNLIMGDLFYAPAGGPPQQEAFIDQATRARLEQQQKELERQKAALADKKETVDTALSRSHDEYNAANQTFRNWLATRQATGNSSQDPEVLNRTHALDALQAGVNNWQRQSDQLADQLRGVDKQQIQVQGQLGVLLDQGEKSYNQALQKYDLRIFFWRLAFTLPLLLLAIWLFIKFRKHRYWPFVYGFGLFALTAFFVELVPYLPSFGGYIRVVVGIILTVFAGVYMLRAFQRYVERKRLEMQQSQTERARTVVYEKAISSYQKKICPSCDKPWNLAGDQASFCIHCGLELFRVCGCGGRNFAFFPFCHQCGKPVKQTADTSTPSLLQTTPGTELPPR